MNPGNWFAKGCAAAALMAAVVASPAAAQTSSQLVRVEIRPINRIAVAGTTTFTIPAKKPGAERVVSATASYAITTNEDNRRITVALDEALPEGVTLKMRMDAPTGAQAAEEIILSTTPQTAVTGISRLNARDLNIGFSLITGSSATVPAATTRTVRVTLASAA